MNDETTQRIATTIVIPTVGRPSLFRLLAALDAQEPPLTAPVIVVDDRSGPVEPLPFAGRGVDVLMSGGVGPARARNLGWRHARTPWISFLDDDVLPGPQWWQMLQEDLAETTPQDVGTEGRVRVPMSSTRRPTDHERVTGRLQEARWITADMSYRRAALAAVGGFDERFRRAYREDADLGLRLTASGGRIRLGRRHLQHPVQPASPWTSVARQRGNADDMLMRQLHGRDWHHRAGASRGRRPVHALVTAAAATALIAAVSGRRRLAATGFALWLIGTTEFTVDRIRRGPRTPTEVLTVIATSTVIPPMATLHTIVGRWRHRHATPWQGAPDLVLFDRDDTLVVDVPYNNDPDQVVPMPGVSDALARLRREGIRTGVVSNQSGVARGVISEAELAAVTDRVESLLGPFDIWRTCPHLPGDGCSCRKPAPGMITDACHVLGVDPARCVVVGDIGADVEAARAAGAAAILVPTSRTRTAEVEAAPRVEATAGSAVRRILAGEW